MPSYKILGTDGKEYGPFSAEELRQWIAQRRVLASTSVQVNGGEWKPLSSFPVFVDALAGSPPAFSAPPSAGPVQTSRMAIASLVCGCFGFLCLPGLAGVALGIMALMKINKNQGRLRGQGLAIAGLCLSGVMLLLAGPALLLPALLRAKAKARQIACVSNLRMIGLGARMYADDNKETFPPDFLSMSNELFSPKLLICPADSKHLKALNWAEFDPLQNTTYEYLHPNIAESNALDQVIFRCPIHDHVGLGDGSVQQRSKNSIGGRLGWGR